MDIKINRTLSKLLNGGGAITPSKVVRTITATTNPGTFTLTSSNGDSYFLNYYSSRGDGWDLLFGGASTASQMGLEFYADDDSTPIITLMWNRSPSYSNPVVTIDESQMLEDVVNIYTIKPISNTTTPSISSNYINITDKDGHSQVFTCMSSTEFVSSVGLTLPTDWRYTTN